MIKILPFGWFILTLLHDPLDDVLCFKQMFFIGIYEISQIARLILGIAGTQGCFGMVLLILGFRELGLFIVVG